MLLSKVVFLFFLAILVLLFLSFSPPPPPPSFHPLLCSPCGSSIYQPVWFSLYLALGGSAAYIKYSKEDRLVQQPSNLCTKRERERQRLGVLHLSATLGMGVSGRPQREGEPLSPSGYHWARAEGHLWVNSVAWMSKSCRSWFVELRGKQKRPQQEEEELCGVSVGGNVQIGFSTFPFVDVCAWIPLIGF